MDNQNYRMPCDALPPEINKWWYYSDIQEPHKLAELIEAHVQERLKQQERNLSRQDRDALLNLIAVADCDADVMISDGKAGGQLYKGQSIKRGIEIIRQFIKETP
jgi:hypothetical protein